MKKKSLQVPKLCVLTAVGYMILRNISLKWSKNMMDKELRSVTSAL